MRIVIYEDKPENFFPLINFFPQFNLHIGMGTVAENTGRHFPRFKFDFIGRDLFNFKLSNRQEPTIYLSGRLLLKEKINIGYHDVRFTVRGEEVGFLKTTPPFPDNLLDLAQVLKDIKQTKEISGLVLNHSWDIIKYNGEIIIEQYKSHRHLAKGIKGLEVVGNRKDLFIAHDARVHRFVFLDVSDGPVYIDKKAEIRPFSTIIGPSYIGEGTILEQAKIIKSSIGPYCRVGGEVEASIFQGFSNKHHEGFIGHSFIGEWVNLGALTTNSDLKNNYSNVRIEIAEKVIDSQMMKLGCFVGDHTKLGIGTLIPTGAVIGSFVNYFGGGLMPKYVPPFKWLGPGTIADYDPEKAISTARLVMKRRGIVMSKEYENLIRTNYQRLKELRAGEAEKL